MRSSEHVLARLGHRAQRGQVEIRADHGRQGKDAGRFGTEMPDALRDHFVHAGRQAGPQEGLVRRPPLGGVLHEAARFRQVPQELPHEVGVAVGVPLECPHEVAGRGVVDGVTRGCSTQVEDLGGGEAAELHPGDAPFSPEGGEGLDEGMVARHFVGSERAQDEEGEPW